MISGDVHGIVTDLGVNAGTIGTLVQSNKSTQESLSQRYLESKWPRSPKAAYNANLGGTASREPCTPGTRVDILQRIYDWAEDLSSNSPSVFWLTGEAGSGKSTIAYSVARHFDVKEADEEEGGDDAPEILGANFFCSRQFEETRQRKSIIPTIIDQLARHSQTYANALLKANKFDSVNIMSKQMKDLLVDPWMQSVSEHHAEFRPFLIVVDALDEIEDRGGLAFLEELLRMIDKSCLRGLKFLITSRPHPDVVKLCSSFTSDAICALYDVLADTVKADIATYLQAKLPKLVGTPVINELMHQADGLFIFAATAVRYITPRPEMLRREQVRLLGELGIHAHGSSGSRNTNVSPIDGLYKQVMFAAFGGLDDNLLQDRLYALHTLLCTQERVSTSVAGELCSDGPEMSELVELVVDELHAVLYVKEDRVLWYHASFPDFIFSQARSGSVLLSPDSRLVDMHCDEAAHHAHLVGSCFRIMKTHLRFNICDLPSSFLLDSEVPDLKDRIRANIGDGLRYSCLHWAQHLSQTSSGVGRKEIGDFLQLKVLFWIEAMNLLDSRARCTPILQQTRECILKDDDGRVSDLARELAEVSNFATYFGGSPASRSTPHLYISSLATWSRDSHLSRMWKKQFSHLPAFEQTGGEGSLPLLTIRDGPFFCVAFSKDDTRIVSGSENQSVQVWDASTGEELRRLNGHSGDVRSVAFSGDGSRIVSGSEDRSVRVWDASTGAELRRLNGHSDSVRSVAFSGDGSRIVSGSKDRSVRVWDALTGAELRRLIGHSNYVLSVAFSGDGTRIVSGSWDMTVRVWDATTGDELKRLNGHSQWVLSVAFSNDDTRIVSGSADKSVRVWDALTGAELRRLNGHSDLVRSVAFSNNGTRIVSGSDDKSVRVWDALTGAELRRLIGHSNYVLSVAFSGDGTRIVSGSWDKSVRVWDASTGEKLMKLNGHSDSVRSVAFSGDGSRIVSGSEDGSVRVWDALTGTELRRLNGHSDYVLSVALSSDCTRIVSGSSDNSVRIWDMVARNNPWEFSSHGWIISLPHYQRLMWVPPELMKLLNLHNVLIISSEPPAKVDFTDSRIGPVWVACYTPICVTHIGQVVPRDSAIIGDSRENRGTIHDDHNSMVKFSRKDDPIGMLLEGLEEDSLHKRHQSVTEIFDAKEMRNTKLPSSIGNRVTTEQDFPMASDFPGAARFVVAQEALDHLERNLATFERIFADFNIQKSDYRLLAGFDEDLIRGHLGFLNQIHLLIRSEPSDITSFLSCLSPALEGFSAFVFTDKSTYRIPSSLPEFHNIARCATHKTARELPSCVSTLSQDVGNVTLTVESPSGQSSNGEDGSSRKGKEREVPERNSPLDSGRTADGDRDPESPGPDGDNTRSAGISFRVISHLHQYDQPRKQDALRGEPFQKLQVQGTVKAKRISESQDPRRFPICDIEFTELRTTFEPTIGNPTYRHFQLDVRIDAKGKYAHITKIQPVSTSKYNPESKFSQGSKTSWSMLASAAFSFPKPQGTIGVSGSRTGEQSIATEKTALVSRIIQRDIGPIVSWSFHIADPFDQDTGLTLSSEKHPHAHFEFRGKTPAPPPEYLTLEISTYWSLLSGSAWLSSKDTPSFSNLCKIITLDLPSHLQGFHKYNAGFLVWPKHSNLGTTMAKLDGDPLEEGVGGLVTTKFVDTDHDIDSST